MTFPHEMHLTYPSSVASCILLSFWKLERVVERILFGIGLFFGVFIIDAVNSAGIVRKLRAFAVENQVDVRWEQLKQRVRAYQDERNEKHSFLRPFKSSRPLREHLRDWLEERGARHEHSPL